MRFPSEMKVAGPDEELVLGHLLAMMPKFSLWLGLKVVDIPGHEREHTRG